MSVTRFCLRRFLTLILFLVLSTSANLFAQENCSNGIDDDGDNLVDVFDPDCPCDNEILLCEPSCEFSFPGGELNFQSQWTSAETIPVYQTPLVADIDNDNTPEVVILSSNSLVSSDPRRAKDLLIINGATGATELTITTPFLAWVGPNPVAIADIDDDGFGEIIVAAMDHPDNAATDRRYLFCYEHTGALKWKSDAPYGYPTVARFGSALGIADINSDGIPEVYVYNQVFNALTGILLAEGGSTTGLSVMTRQPFGDLANPVAADLTAHPGLELACGNTVYEITITNAAGTAGNTINAISIPAKNDGYTSLADINLDGSLDVIVASEGSNGEVYVWNPNNGSPTVIASRTLPNTGGNWIGVPFVGDMDKDCQPEIGVTRATRVFALDYNGSGTLQNKWTLTTSDASGFTGITMFDFNQDGTQELVYRDESTLRIIDGSGSTPVTIGTNVCGSGTGSEMPVVADVDGDGQAEICVSCQTSTIQLGQLNVFEATGQPWAPCRSVWNQFNYFNININGNLSVPLQQQQHQVLLSTVTCPFSTCSENRPFNSFLTQATFLTQEGCPIYPAADISLSFVSGSCNNSTEYTLSVRVNNIGGGLAQAGFPVRFYVGNPFSSAATELVPLSGIAQTTQSLLPGQNEVITVTLDILSLPKPFNLFAVLNDDGSVPPPFNFPLSSIPDCNFNDNVVGISAINCCPFGDLDITGITPENAIICENTTQNISVTASSSAGLTGAEYTWIAPDNSSLTGASITATQNGQYIITVKDDAQCLSSDTVSLTVFPLPTEAAAGTDQEICTASTSLEGNVPTVGSGLWSLISGTGSITDPTAPTSTVTDIAVGTSVFRWSITSGGICISDDTVSITRIPAPTTATAGADQEICGENTALTANSPSVGTGFWTLVSGSGIISDAANPSTSISGLATGDNIFQWNINNSICPVSSDQVVITRFIAPQTPNAGADQQICSDAAQLSAVFPPIGTGSWTVISGSSTITEPSNPTSGLSSLSLGENILRWTVSNGTCPPLSDEVVIFRDALPGPAIAGTDFSVCSDVATLAAQAPTVGSGLWSLSAGSGLLVNANSVSSSVSGLGEGLNTFIWTVSNGVCPSVSSSITIQRDLPPDAAVVGSPLSICGENASLNANLPVIGTGVWAVLSGSGIVTNPSNPQSTVGNLNPGNNQFVWTVSNGVCPANADTISITSNELITANAGTDLSICSENSVLSGNNPTPGVGLWSIVSGSAIINDAQSFESSLGAISPGNTELVWTITNGACVSSDTLLVTRSLPPSAAQAGSDQEICATSTTLNATIPIIGTGAWSIVSGSATIDNPNNPSEVINSLSTGVNILLWTISNGACTPNTDSVTILVDKNPLNPDAGADQNVCASSAELSANPTINGFWQVISGTGLFTDTTLANITVTGLTVGENVFRWNISNGSCEAFDEVTIVRSIPPSPADAGTDAFICEGASLLLNANNPIAGTGSWSLASGSGTFNDNTLSNATFTGTSAGSALLVWSIQNGSCPIVSDSIIITVNPPPSAALAGSNQEICGDSALLNATAPIAGAGEWSLISGTGTITAAASASTSITGISAGPTILQWTVRSEGCPSDSSQITITAFNPPSISNAGSDVIICSDSTLLQANTPAAGQGFWTIITGSGTFSNAANPQSGISEIGDGVNVYQWTISNGVCPPSTDQVVVQRDSLFIAANAGNDFSICTGDTAALQAADPFPGIGVWTLVSGNATIEDTLNPNTSVSSITGTTAVFRWTVTTGNCPPSFDDITISVSQPPSESNAGLDTSICISTFALNGNIPTIGTGTWSLVDGSAIISEVSNASSEVTGLEAGNNVFVWTISNGVCAAENDTVVINVSQDPINPNAGPDLSICSDSATLSAASPSLGAGVWQVVSGSVEIADSLSAASDVLVNTVGVSVLTWTVSNGACIASDTMEITRSAPPDSSFAGSDVVVCDSMFALNAITPITGIGQWSALGSTITFSDFNDPQAQVSGLTPGDNILVWTVSSGVCPPNTDQVIINRVVGPDSVFAGNDQSICSDTALLNANVPLSGSGIWSVVSGSATLSDPLDATTELTGIPVGTVVLRWTVGVAGCPEVFDEVSLSRSAPPDAAITGNDFTACSQPVNLSANQPSVGVGSWIVVSGNALLENAAENQTTATGLNTGNNVFEWRIVNGSCPPSTDQITVTLGDTAFAGNDIFSCDSTLSLSATQPSLGFGTWTLIAGSAIISDSSNANSTIQILTDESVTLLWTVTGGVCSDSTDEINIIRFCSDPPLITNDSIVLLEDSLWTGNLLNNGDSDPNGSTLIADTNLVQAPTNGTLSVNADGSFTYVPNENYYGPDTAIVAVCDIALVPPGQCGFDTLFIVVQPVNDTPTVANEIYTTPVDSSISGNVLENDSDPVENTSMSSSTLLIQGATNGVFIIDTEGNFAYTPNPGFAGADTIIVSVCDSGIPLPEICLPDTVFIFINDSINEPPVIENDSLVTFEDQSLQGDFLQNDFDPDGTTLLADTTALSGPSNGTIDINPDGTFTYVPDSNYYGLDTVIVNVCDQGIPLPELCVPDTIIILVLPVNDPPIIENEYESISFGDTLNGNILTNDADLETPLNADTVLIDGPNNGTFTLNTDGSYTYIPNDGFTGIDTIVIAVCDSGFPLPELCANDTVFITVGSVTWTIDAGEDQTLCGFDATLLANTPPEGSNAFWDQLGGTAVISDPSNNVSFVSGLSPGENIFVWSVTFENITQTDTVIITANEPATTSSAGENQTICGNSANLEANIPVAGSGVWISLTSGPTLSDSLSNTAAVNQLNLGTNEFVWFITNGNCTSSDTVQVTSFTPAMLNAGDDTTFCGQQNEFTPLVELAGSANLSWALLSGGGSFSNDTVLNPLISGLAIGTNTFIVTATNGACVVSDTIAVEVLDPLSSTCAQQDVFIPDGFSPDGDGQNDRFEIFYVNGKRIKIEVYNRWGTLVYSNENYQNEWDGRANQGTILWGEQLPESTYYYLIEIEGEAEIRKGYLTLWR
ncbi:MAG: tandem-95 repeat protein [Bacteroidia bacterium]